MKSETTHRIEALRKDLRWSVRYWLINRLAGHPLMIKPLRYVLYRRLGVKTESLNVNAGVTILYPRGLTIGRGTFINHGVFLDASDKIVIGKDCAFAPRVTVMTITHPLEPTGWEYMAARGGAVHIGDRCWLAAGVVVLPGVSITANTVVAAGSVVTRSITEPGVYAGSPARRIREWAPMGARQARS